MVETQQAQRQDSNVAAPEPQQAEPAQSQSPQKQQAIQAAATAVSQRLGGAKPQSPGFFDRIKSVVEQGGDKVIDDARKVVGGTEQLANSVKDHLIDAGGEAVGVAELAGLRYPVTQYAAEVESGVLWRGSRVESPEQMAGLMQQHGIKGFVNLCLEMNDDAKAAAGLAGLNPPVPPPQLLHIPIMDNTSPTVAQMKQFIDFVRNNGNDPVYVHCEAGKGRTGTAVACFRMAVDGWSAEQALAEYKSMGGALPNQMKFIEEFGSLCKSGQI